MKNKFFLKILIIAVVAGISSVLIHFYSLKLKEKNVLSMSCVRQDIQLNDERGDIRINYPQLSEMDDREKEKRLNSLIEKDAMKILERDVSDNEGRFTAGLDYDIKYMDDQAISILYKGWFGAVGARCPDIAMATSIDIERERILTLDDVVSDYDQLYDLLTADKFENITKWDGVAGQYTIGQDYEYKEVSTLMEDLNGDDEDIEWYIDDGHFVIVVLNGLPDYNEYAISLQEAKGFLQKEFLKKIN